MSVLLIVVLGIFGIYMVLNFKHDLQMFQQNSYRTERYWKWLSSNLLDTWRLVDVAQLLILFSTLLDTRLSIIVVGTISLVKIYLILNKKYKKPLVLTRRIWRLYAVTALLASGAYLGVILSTPSPVSFGSMVYQPASIDLGVGLLITIFSWIPMLMAAWILQPVEKSINMRYTNDAKRILASKPDMTVIGITGSYGKTSTKHYLQRILSEKYNVLMTPGSFNTPMGVTRTIREYLKPYNEVFICEMGAKQPGDIKEICNIVHPSIGIITAVGPMHLETFKSLEKVQSTKFELADSLPPDGLAVVNNDFDKCADRAVDNVEVIRYGVTNPAGCKYVAEDISYDSTGASFIISGPQGFSLKLTTRLVGECNISNLLAAVIVALHLEVPVENIRYAIADIEQIEHRLNMKRTANGVTIIDDAFNSNPTGSRMALEVLGNMTGGKRIVVTPGMIELGSEQFNLNRQLGETIADNVDVAIIVGQYNRKALLEGLENKNFSDSRIKIVESFAEAQNVLGSLLTQGDTVLYENDLPDTFK